MSKKNPVVGNVWLLSDGSWRAHLKDGQMVKVRRIVKFKAIQPDE